MKQVRNGLHFCFSTNGNLFWYLPLSTKCLIEKEGVEVDDKLSNELGATLKGELIKT